VSVEHPVCISARGVPRRFGDKEVLHGISLTVRSGENFGLLGPSGSGKTTLVKLLAGIDRATAGEIDVLGARMPELEVMRRIGYMAQSDALYTEPTARENLEFFGAMFGLRGGALRRRIGETMELVGLSEHLNRVAGRIRAA